MRLGLGLGGRRGLSWRRGFGRCWLGLGDRLGRCRFRFLGVSLSVGLLQESLLFRFAGFGVFVAEELSPVGDEL